MKKLYTILTMLMLFVSGAWATEVTWESKSGWTQASGGKAGLNWFGAMTPGTTDMEYTLDEFQIMHEIKSNDNQDCYIAIAKSYSTTTLSTSEVVAVSNNHILPTAVQLYTYNFDGTVTLKGGTTYYIVFLRSNTPTDGAYPVGEGRVALNHTSYGAYTPGVSYSGGSQWWPYYKATLTTQDPLTDYNYTCKNLAGYTIGSGVYSQTSAPDASQAPVIGGYSYSSINVDGTNVTYTYSLTTNPLSSLTTAAANIDSNPTYIILASIASSESSTFYYFADSDGNVKGNFNQSTKEDATHWIIVGDETNGYKFYNARFGSAKVAQATNGSAQPITMVDATSNDGTLFDIRYIGGAYRFYYKGTQYCTNRLSSTTQVIGIHENVNAGSETTVFRYYTNALYKQSDINPAKIYTIKSGARGYIFVNSNGYVANNHNSTAESAAADAYYQWTFVQANNEKYYLYNVGAGKFVGTLSSDGGRATVTNLSTTDYFYLTSTKSTSYYPLYLTGYSYNTSTFADNGPKYINTQGTSGDNLNVVYNYWNTLDGGNDFLITELSDFSAANQLIAKTTLRILTGGLYAENAAALRSAADDTAWKVYTIKGKLGTLEANSDGTYLTNTGKSGSTVEPAANSKQQWVLIHTDGNSYLLYNIGADKYLSNDGSDNYALVSDRTSASTVQFRKSTTGDPGSTAGLLLNFPIGIGVGSAWLNLNNNYTYGTTNYDYANDVNNMFRIEEIDGLCYLTSGFYRLKSKLISDEYGYMGVSGTQLVGNISDPNDISTVLYINRNGEGKFTIQAQGQYTSGVRQNNEVSLGNTAPEEAFTLSSTNGYVVFRTHADGPYSYYHAASGNGYKIVGWESVADASQWNLNQATSLTVSLNNGGDGNYYATLCVPFDFTISGATVYTLTQSGDWLVPTAVEGTVAAGTPVLLKGAAATATLTIGTGYATTPQDGTALTGTYVAKTVSGSTDYFLGIKNGVVGFYHWNQNTLGANRAYLPAQPNGANGFSIVWDETTGISGLTPALSEGEGAVYDLQGRRLGEWSAVNGQLPRGIYVVNGKKVVVK